MDGKQLSQELAELFRCFGARPIFVSRGPGAQRFGVVRVTIDLQSLGGPVTIEVAPIEAPQTAPKMGTSNVG